MIEVIDNLDQGMETLLGKQLEGECGFIGGTMATDGSSPSFASTAS
ncbi:MAG: hypothetical protein PUP91_03290 [Rhizonema sp. PD37]|nr:hypothetical protein [Rhizonema sp. PD37]